MAFNTDTERMLESASRLESIRDEVLSFARPVHDDQPGPDQRGVSGYGRPRLDAHH